MATLRGCCSEPALIRSEPQVGFARLRPRQRLLFLGDAREIGSALRVDGDPDPRLVRQVGLLVDRLHRTGRNAGAAVDADVVVDVQHLVVAVEARDRAHGHAVGEAASLAVARYDGRHESPLLLRCGHAPIWQCVMTNRRAWVRAMRRVESWTRISRCVCLTGTAMEPFLIAAVTGRALAASAARSGVPVVVLDCFADRDTRGLARRCRSVVARQGLRFDARALLAAAAELAPWGRCAGLVYGSGFEGRTGLLGRLARGRRLCGNEPSVVAAVKDVRRFLPLLDRLGIRYPETRFTAPPPPQARPARLAPAGWLVKHPGGAGGAHVRRAARRRVRGGAYFQRFEGGRSLSAVFLADGRRAAVIRFDAQWDPALRR